VKHLAKKFCTTLLFVLLGDTAVYAKDLRLRDIDTELKELQQTVSCLQLKMDGARDLVCMLEKGFQIVFRIAGNEVRSIRLRGGKGSITKCYIDEIGLDISNYFDAKFFSTQGRQSIKKFIQLLMAEGDQERDGQTIFITSSRFGCFVSVENKFEISDGVWVRR